MNINLNPINHHMNGPLRFTIPLLITGLMLIIYIVCQV